jgi:hypothetical protein
MIMIMIALNSSTIVEDTEYLQESQKEWADEDTYKNFDFSRHNFWITSDDGVVGHGFIQLKTQLRGMQANMEQNNEKRTI